MLGILLAHIYIPRHEITLQNVYVGSDILQYPSILLIFFNYVKWTNKKEQWVV